MTNEIPSSPVMFFWQDILLRAFFLTKVLVIVVSTPTILALFYSSTGVYMSYKKSAYESACAHDDTVLFSIYDAETRLCVTHSQKKEKNNNNNNNN